jgi:hypothetical protein
MDCQQLWMLKAGLNKSQMEKTVAMKEGLA